MKTPISKSPSPRRIILLPLGSTPIQVVQALRTHEMIADVPLQRQTEVVAFDAQGVEHTLTLPTVDKSLSSVRLMSSEIVAGSISDPETRYKAEQQGKIWMTLTDYSEDPGVTRENVGVGGNSRQGRALYALNKNTHSSQFVNRVRTSQDYQQQTAGRTATDVTIQPIVQVIVIVSSVGGTGAGALPPVLEMIAEKAAKLKANIRITPIVLLMGTLDPGDRQKAARNQQLVLRSLQARLEGKFRDLDCCNGDYQVLTEPPILVSNANNFGEIADLTRLITMLAQYLYLVCQTSFGPQQQQQAINLHDAKLTDEPGSLQGAATFGLTSISCNKQKIRACTASQMGYLSLVNLLAKHETAEPAKRASAAASSQGLVENNVDDMATQGICRLSKKNNMHTQVRGKSLFHQKAGGRRGFRGCLDLYQAAQQILGKEIPRFLVPAMTEQAAIMLSESQQLLSSEIARYMERQTGLSEARQFQQHLQELLARFEKFNREKLHRAETNNNQLRKAKASCEKVFHKLRKKNRLLRALSVFAKASFRRDYPICVDALIQNELEIAARKLVDKKVFRPLQQTIKAELNRLAGLKNTINNLCDQFNQEVQRLRNLPNDFDTPVGCGLATTGLIDQTLQKVLLNEGGKDAAITRVFEAFCGKYHSLAAFGLRDPGEIAQFLLQHCEDTAKHTIAQLHVLDAFRAAFPTEQQQYEVIGQQINQSDGRIRTSGEGDKHIARVKHVCGPNNASVQCVVKVANDISRLGGDWRGHVDEHLSDILFVQYRTQVSFNQQIADAAKLCHLPDDPKERVLLGEDPIIQFAPDAEPRQSGIDLVIAEGLISKQIPKNKHGYELQGLHEPMHLGTSLDDVRRCLAVHYDSRMRIYRQFCLMLVKSHQELLENTEQMINNNSTAGDPLVSQLGVAPFQTVQSIAEVLLSHTMRIQLGPMQNERKQDRQVT